MNTEKIQPKKRVQRQHAFLSAVMLTLFLLIELSWFDKILWIHLFFLIVFVFALTEWVLGFSLKFESRHTEIYALHILPIVMTSALVLFLDEVVRRTFLNTYEMVQIYSTSLFTVIVFLPVFYLMYISLSALEKYRMLPNHVGRVVLNILSLFAGFITYSFIFQSDIPIHFEILLVFILSWLLFVQGVFWWSNGNIRYSIYYATLSSYILSLMAFSIAFWPFGSVIKGVSLMIGLYLLMGLVQNYFKKSISFRIVMEYVVVSIVLMVMVLFQVNWQIIL